VGVAGVGGKSVISKALMDIGAREIQFPPSHPLEGGMVEMTNGEGYGSRIPESEWLS
jgi:hypothetical protein